MGLTALRVTSMLHVSIGQINHFNPVLVIIHLTFKEGSLKTKMTMHITIFNQLSNNLVSNSINSIQSMLNDTNQRDF